MPVYTYKATHLNGKTIKGTVEIGDRDQLYAQLREQDMFLVSCREKETNTNNVAIPSKVLADFSRELGTMLNSGISLTRALSIIVSRCDKKEYKKIYDNLYQRIQQGYLLSDAMQEQGRAFPLLMINMVKAGENSGKLEEIALKLANHYEKDTKLQAKVKNASTYPILLGCLTVAVVIIIFTAILPQFFSLFQGMDLPWTTKLIMKMSTFLTHNWLLAIIIAAIGICVIMLILRNKTVRDLIDKLKLKLPIISNIMVTIYTARFARGLSSLYSSGLSMVQSLQICQGLIGNMFIEKQFSDIISNVKNGVALSKSIATTKGLDKKLASTIYIGEESGRINEILENMADSYDYDAEQATQRLITLIEPVMIIIMAVIIGTIVLSVMLPIFQYYQSIS